MTGRTRTLEEFQGSLLERLRLAAEDLAAHPGTTLYIPPGDYRLETPLARQLRAELMNGGLGDDPEKLIFTPYFPYDTALSLCGVHHCTVEATGARFLLAGPMQALSLEACSQVVVRGLEVDCMPKPFTTASVVRKGTGYLDLQLPADSGVSERTPAPRIVPILPDGGFASGCMESFSRTALAPGIIRYFGGPDLPSWAGGKAVLIHTYHYRPALFLAQSHGIHLENVTVRAQYGMGLLAWRCQDLSLRTLNVIPSPGAAISVNTDACHFASCDGTIQLEHCCFHASEDDALNVHNYYYDAVPLGRTNYLLPVNSPTFPHAQVIDAPLPGEILGLYDRNTLQPLGNYTVTAQEEDHDALAARVTLDRPLDQNGLLLNQNLQPRIIVRDCQFQSILTRCLLLRGKTVLVTGCTFRDCPGTAVHIAPETQWREGGGVGSALLEHNLFDHVGFGDYGIHGNASVLCVEGGCPSPSMAVHGRILFRNNQLQNLSAPRPSLSVSGAETFRAAL